MSRPAFLAMSLSSMSHVNLKKINTHVAMSRALSLAERIVESFVYHAQCHQFEGIVCNFDKGA